MESNNQDAKTNNAPPLSEIKKQIEMRNAVRIPEALWELIEIKDLGIDGEAALAGPDWEIHNGPGGGWKLTKNIEGALFEPITEHEARVLRKSISE